MQASYDDQCIMQAKAAIVIQRHIRGHAACKKLDMQIQAATVISRWWLHHHLPVHLIATKVLDSHANCYTLSPGFEER